MPKLSDTMEEGKIIRWMKQRGDRVAIGDVLAEVETDKANMELEAFDEGVLAEIRTGEGEAAPVGAVIALLGEPGEATDGQTAAPDPAGGKSPSGTKETAAEPDAGGAEKQASASPAKREARASAGKASPAREKEKREQDETPDGEIESADGERVESSAGEAPAAETTGEEQPEGRGKEGARRGGPSDAGTSGRVRASPLARRIARERGVDLTAVQGSGPGGRVVERDVPQAAPKRPAAGEPASRPRAVASAAKPAAEKGEAGGRPGTRVELGKIRRTTATRMTEAKRTVPHFYASSDIAMDECVRLKDGLAALEGEYTGITFTHLVLKAVGLVLRRVPEMNASFDGDTIVLHDTAHIGLATATDDGLIVPVVRDCDRQPLGALVASARALIERARAGKFAADDLRGATFTVSNLGMFPVSHFAAVVNPPQVAILAVGTVREVPVVREGRVAPGHVMSVTLSCDHRAVDGAIAGRFLKELNALLGSPLALVA